MPLFFIISGFCFSTKNIYQTGKEYRLRIGKRYIISYFGLCILNMCIELIKQIGHGNLTEILIQYLVGIFYSRGSVQWMPNCSPLWFLTALFIALSIFQSLIRIKYVALKVGLILLCPLISYGLYLIGSPKLFWNIDSALMGVLFIFFGYLFKHAINVKEFKKRPRAGVGLGLCLGVVGYECIMINDVGAVSFDDNVYGNFIYMLLGSLALSILVMIMCMLFVGIYNGFLSKVVSFLGRNTLFLMAFDYQAGDFAVFLIRKLHTGFSWEIWFAMKCMVLFGSLMVFRLVRLKGEQRTKR